MKAVVAAFNQEKALVGAFSMITILQMELFQALVSSVQLEGRAASGGHRIERSGYRDTCHQPPCHAVTLSRVTLSREYQHGACYNVTGQ